MHLSTPIPAHAPGTGQARTLAEVDVELERLTAADDRYTDAHWQLRAAVAAYLDHRGHDLAGAAVELVCQRLEDIDTSYNFTAATSVEQYAMRWHGGRLTGEDLEWQIAWYSNLVAAATAGSLPPLLVHDDGTRRFVVDGGHRLSAHRSAGLDVAAAYLVRT